MRPVGRPAFSRTPSQPPLRPSPAVAAIAPAAAVATAPVVAAAGVGCFRAATTVPRRRQPTAVGWVDLEAWAQVVASAYATCSEEPDSKTFRARVALRMEQRWP